MDKYTLPFIALGCLIAGLLLASLALEVTNNERCAVAARVCMTVAFAIPALILLPMGIEGIIAVIFNLK